MDIPHEPIFEKNKKIVYRLYFKNKYLGEIMFTKNEHNTTYNAAYEFTETINYLAFEQEEFYDMCAEYLKENFGLNITIKYAWYQGLPF